MKNASSQATTEEEEIMVPRSGLPVCVAGVALLMSIQNVLAAEATKDVVVFDFEMMDSSAGAGVIPPDEFDARYLAESTQAAKDSFVAAGAYKIVDAKPASAEIAKVGDLRRCNGCEATIASKLGGDLAVTGVVNRISRTEYEMLIKVVDTNTGAPVAVGYTGLRMGANYSWPRGVKWLMERRVLARLASK
jgi:hypothetical protein